MRWKHNRYRHISRIHIPFVSADVDGDADGTDCDGNAAAVTVPACCRLAALDWFTVSLTDGETDGISASALVFCTFTDSLTVAVTSASLTAPGSLAVSFMSGSRLTNTSLPLLKWVKVLKFTTSDQHNPWFHGYDIFHQTGRHLSKTLPWNLVKFRNFPWISTNLVLFMKVFCTPVGKTNILAYLLPNCSNQILLRCYQLSSAHLHVTVCLMRSSFIFIFIRVAPNLTFSNSAEAEFGRISELKFGRSRSRIWLKLVFWSENNTPVIKLMASTMLSAAIEAVHFSASFVALLFASYW